MLRNVSADVQEYKSQGLDVESVKDLDLTKKYDKKWGQGDLISGRQFVGFVYNTLPKQKAKPSKRSLPGKGMNGQHAKANMNSSTRFFAKKATLVMGDRGKAALSFDFNERADDQFDLSERDALTGLSSSKALPTRDFVVGNGADPQASFSFELVNPSDRVDLVNLDGRLKRATFDGDLMEIEVVFDADDLSLGHYSALATDGAVELESVQIDQLGSCS